MGEAIETLAAIGAVDGATALGLAMQTHVVGALVDSPGSRSGLRDRIYQAILENGALVNNAATEEGGGSPARGAIPGTIAVAEDGAWRLTGEKTWTTWLPNLSFAFVTARFEDTEPAEVGTFLVDLASPGVERLPGFEALGMRGSASGRLRLDAVRVTEAELLVRRTSGRPDPRGPAPGAWFGMAVAGVYLGIGEGARTRVAAWAVERRPGDGTSAVADLPTVLLRLGRLDAALRSARMVVLDVARRYDEVIAAGARQDPAMLVPVVRDVPLAKLEATRAAVEATDAALRIAGGPGFLAGRLERAFRDARAGLINPPLEDVTLSAFGQALVAAARAGR